MKQSRKSEEEEAINLEPRNRNFETFFDTSVKEFRVIRVKSLNLFA
jgi:hypothetical protein